VALPVFAGANRPTITSYDGWGCSSISNFDPAVNTFFQLGPWVDVKNQPTTIFGNATRFNPHCRQFPYYNENISVNRKIKLTEKLNLDFRVEAFNTLNRVRFGTGNNQIQSQVFGKVSTNNDIFNVPRQVQLALRLNF
jgi:hypothetical protein